MLYIAEVMCHTLSYLQTWERKHEKGTQVFGELVIAYLFLAGTGAGGIVVACLVDLLWARTPFGTLEMVGWCERSALERQITLALTASTGALVLGAACLAVDLGRPDRALSLFFGGSFNVMTVGAWSLALLIALGMALSLVRLLYLPCVRSSWVRGAEVAALGVAFVVAVYAGLLLQTLAGVRLWSSGWVPVLFVLSAASCGCAVFMGAALFVEVSEEQETVVARVAAIDLVIVVLEVLAAAAFLVGALASDHPGVEASLQSLLHGTAALPWWVGFVLCGLGAPFVLEGALLLRRRCARNARWVFRTPPAAYAAVALLVLVGGVGLRAAVVEAGEQRPLELQEVAAEGSIETREDRGLWLS